VKAVEGIGIVKAAKRTGLTREQIVYIERRGYLGAVARDPDGTRRFSEAQLCKLEKIGACRTAGLRLDEASAIASTGFRPSHDELVRLYKIAARKAGAIRRELEAWEYVFSLIQAARDPDAGSPAA
jgi:DNA-binding transcriptional MerR regulator